MFASAARASLSLVASAAALAVLLSACAGDATVAIDDGGGEPSSPTATAPPTPTADPTVGTYPAYAETDYDFTVRIGCYCPDRGPVRIEVRDGKAVAGTYLRKGFGHAKGDPAPDYRLVTIEEIIDAANNTEAASVEVEWPQGQGYPDSVYVDRVEQMVDEEMGWTITNVRPL